MVATDTTSNQQDSSALTLVSILKGEYDVDVSENEVEVLVGEKINFFSEGKKLDNKAMRILLARLKGKFGYDDAKLLQIYLLFDQALEEGILSQEVLDSLEA